VSRSRPRLGAGTPDLGARWDGRGIGFALFSRHAEKVELCLFSADGAREERRISLPERTGDVWHVHVADLEPGQVYGYRVYGPYQPARGHRFNHHKLLLDPYAAELVGQLTYDEAVFGYRDDPFGADAFDDRDSAPFVPKARVVAVLPPVEDFKRPGLKWSETVVYEAHVRGHTMQHPAVPESLRGTFAGLATPEVIEHLVALGVTAIELMPVQAFVSELPLVRRGHVNYWGYNSLAWFAPHAPYLAGNVGREIRDTVDALHKAGLEVILDVVFNHTAEGDETGPTLSLRGLDNAVYYRPDAHDPARYANHSGCGNSVNAAEPAVAALIVDALRHWAQQFGVDGFRLDLAASLSRAADGAYAADTAAIAAISRDPLLSRLKLIAEPWDLGPGGHVTGKFPAGWVEWNDRFRDTARRFWTGVPAVAPELASRIAGSHDLFGRAPHASLNYITSHDGFTLADLVSYARKHNSANGWDDRDGSDANISTNAGVEGPSNDPCVRERRLRRMKNLMATALLAQGTPMILAGDETGRTQNGNNNAYCQDNEISWTDWREPAAYDLRSLIQTLARLRQSLRVFNADPLAADTRVVWLRPDGASMTRADWDFGAARSLAFVLSEAPVPGDPVARRGFLYVVLNASDVAIRFSPPLLEGVERWTRMVDTSSMLTIDTLAAGDSADFPGDAVAVFAGRTTSHARNTSLEAELDRHGIESGYADIWGRQHPLASSTAAALLSCLQERQIHLPPTTTWSSEKCYWPAALDLPRGLWGISVQLYSLRSERNWGIGDFGDLQTLINLAADLGASVVGINPLHALFSTDYSQASPYYPSSRLFLDWLMIDIESVPGFDDQSMQAILATNEFQERLAMARASPLVERRTVAACKRPVLEQLYRAFRSLPEVSPEMIEFRKFTAVSGRNLRIFATFQALSEHLAAITEPNAVWYRDWPEVYRDPDSPAVAAFANAHLPQIEFFEFLQWLADRQLGACATLAKARGMPIGLYRDLAVGAPLCGAEAWSEQKLVVKEFEIGAPPDPFAADGQAWGIAPWHPGAIAANEGAPFARLLAANMRHAGALRLDHVMGVRRLFWIPRGGSAADGGYVRYPMDTLLGVLACESRHHQCLVIGEDLGTVQAGFRERLREANILSYRVLYFEREPDGGFLAPRHYPVNALATVTTHDLPTLTAFWEHQVADRARLIAALRQARVIGENEEVNAPPTLSAYRFLAAGSTRLVMVQIEDILGVREQVNKPGTTDEEHPNWRRKLPLTLAQLTESSEFQALAQALADRRYRKDSSQGPTPAQN